VAWRCFDVATHYFEEILFDLQKKIKKRKKQKELIKPINVGRLPWGLGMLVIVFTCMICTHSYKALYNFNFLAFKGARRGGTQSPPSSPCCLAHWSQRIDRERIARRALPLLPMKWQWWEGEMWRVGKLSPLVQWAVTDQCETGNSCMTCFVQATCSSATHAPWPLSKRRAPGDCIVYIMGCFQVPPPTLTSIRPLK